MKKEEIQKRMAKIVNEKVPEKVLVDNGIDYRVPIKYIQRRANEDHN